MIIVVPALLLFPVGSALFGYVLLGRSKPATVTDEFRGWHSSKGQDFEKGNSHG